MKKDTNIIASSFIDLKAKVKAEMQRRQYTGSVSNYGGSDYDYSITPAKDGKILVEHIDKIKVPLDAVNSSTNPIKDKNIVKELETVDAHITYLKSASLTSSSSGTGCMASCTGLCSTSCTGTCSTGCSGCSGCGGACSSGCSGGCSGCSGCGGACSSGCSGGCSGGCSNICSGCGGACSSGCSTACGFGCTGCTGNGGSCSGSCGGSCASM